MTNTDVNEQTDSAEGVGTPESTPDALADGEAGDVAAPPADELAEMQARLQKAEDQIKRQAAEFQNYRRRTDTEKRQTASIGKSMVLQRLLDVFDDVNRSVVASVDAPTSTPEELQKSFDSLRSGVDLAYQKLMDELGKLDVHVIEAEGRQFDEELHEAVMQQPAPEGVEPGTILTEVQRGFTMGERVLRHAKVIVAS